MCPFPLARALLRFYADPSRKLAVTLVNAIDKRVIFGHPRGVMRDLRKEVALCALENLNAYPAGVLSVPRRRVPRTRRAA
jgi:hypothetical protein